MPSQRGAGNIASRARSAVASASATRTAKKEDAATWTAIKGTLDPVAIAQIAALVNQRARERHMPSKHPAVQELRASLSGKTVSADNRTREWTAYVGDCKLWLTTTMTNYIGEQGIHLSITLKDNYRFDAFGEFRWNWPDRADGVYLYTTNKDLTSERERLFYAALSVVLPRLKTHSDDIAAAVPTMQVYFYRKDREGYDTLKKTTTVAARVRKLYGTAGGRGGAGAAGAQSVRRGAQGPSSAKWATIASAASSRRVSQSSR